MIKQEAILLTKDNLSAVANTLSDYSVDDLRAESDHLFLLNGAVVLATMTIDDMRMVSYIVHESLYKANNDNFAALNDTTYVPVNNI